MKNWFENNLVFQKDLKPSKVQIVGFLKFLFVLQFITQIKFNFTFQLSFDVSSFTQKTM